MSRTNGRKVSFKDCSVLTSRVEPEQPVKTIWAVQGLHNPSYREIIKDEASANVKVSCGGIQSTIAFWLENYTNVNGQTTFHYLSLRAALRSGGGGQKAERSLRAEVEVHQLDQETLETSAVILPRKIVRLESSNKNVEEICPEFILVKEETRGQVQTANASPYVPDFVYGAPMYGHPFMTINVNQGNLGNPAPVAPQAISHSLPDRLVYGIIVTPIQCSTTRSIGDSNGNELSNAMAQLNIKTPSSSTAGSIAGMSRDFGNFYFDIEDNYSDLKLESRDGMVLNAHKFVVASRSNVFHAIIEMDMKQNEFKGIIRVMDVDAKPLMAILHWMYTGGLREGFQNIVEELVRAAKVYGLAELLQMLDKELIKICDADNMLKLIQVAKDNGLETAVKEISAFIKANL